MNGSEDQLKKAAVLKSKEFFQGGEKSTIEVEVMTEIRKETEQQLVDLVYAKRSKDWNELHDKIPGFE